MLKEVASFSAAVFVAGTVLAVKDPPVFAQENSQDGLTVDASCDNSILLKVKMHSADYRGIALRVTNQESADDAYPAWTSGSRVSFSVRDRVPSLVNEQPDLILEPNTSFLVEALKISHTDFWHHLVENWVILEKRVRILAAIPFSVDCKNS